MKRKINVYNILTAFYNRGFLDFISEESKVKLKYRSRTGKKLNLNNPRRYNEKLQWLKVNWKDPLAVICADKYEVRDYVESKIGSEYLNELIDVYDSVDDIIIENLPEQFVLKGTHGSGYNIIVKNKHLHDWDEEFKKMRSWLNTDYSKTNSEWLYSTIKPRIICERYLEDTSTGELRDYKFFTFHGEPKYMFIASDRENDTRFDYFDIDFNHIDMRQKYAQSGKKLEKPQHYDQMVQLSRLLASDFPHVRVDFFECNDKIYFGELTFFHFSGNESFYPDKYDFILGDLIDLSKIE